MCVEALRRISRISKFKGNSLEQSILLAPLPHLEAETQRHAPTRVVRPPRPPPVVEWRRLLHQLIRGKAGTLVRRRALRVRGRGGDGGAAGAPEGQLQARDQRRRLGGSRPLAGQHHLGGVVERDVLHRVQVHDQGVPAVEAARAVHEIGLEERGLSRRHVRHRFPLRLCRRRCQRGRWQRGRGPLTSRTGKARAQEVDHQRKGAGEGQPFAVCEIIVNLSGAEVM